MPPKGAREARERQSSAVDLHFHPDKSPQRYVGVSIARNRARIAADEALT